jgi:hypothetical protein
MRSGYARACRSTNGLFWRVLLYFLCLLAIPGLVDLADGKWPVALLALLFGYSLLGGAVGRNVIWIITPEGILIGEQRPFRPLHRRLIRKDNILEMHLRANPTSSASPSKSDQKT